MWSQGCRDQWRLYLLCVVTRRRNDLKGLSALCSLHHRYQWNRRSMYVLHPVVGANSESRLHRRFTYTVDQLMGLTINCTPLHTHFNPSIYKRHNSLQHGETKDKRIYSWALRRKKTIWFSKHAHFLWPMAVSSVATTGEGTSMTFVIRPGQATTFRPWTNQGQLITRCLMF